MITIKPTTKLLGLIGYPVAHSISPAMHNAAFRELGLDFAYVPLPVKPDRADYVKDAVLGLRALGFVGANVTVPHKRSVVPHLDRISDAAKTIGAVNTIKINSGLIEGDNTDWNGFLNDLASHDLTPSGASIAVIGSGGSVRAIAYALAIGEAEKVTILARNENKANRLALGLSERFRNTKFSSGSLQRTLNQELEKADMVVNCTPVGMAGYPESSFQIDDEPLMFRENQIVYDLVYNPLKTPFIKRAEECGSKALSGLGMVVRQGAESFETWTGKEAPIDTMFEVASRSLGEFSSKKDS